MKRHFQDKDDITARKSKMKKVFQTQDKRTVRRRLAKLKESIAPEASRMPLYQMINDPFGTILGVENVKKNVRMADSGLLKCA